MSDSTAPVVLWDVDDVLSPHVPTDAHVGHVYDGPGPTGEPATGTVFLNPEHGEWMVELTSAGASHAWITSWGPLAASWIAPRLHAPASDWAIVDVGVRNGVLFGRSTKFTPISAFLATDRPAFWVDNVIGGKDEIWAEERTERGVPTVTQLITSTTGLSRSDIEAALAWLCEIRAARG